MESWVLSIKGLAVQLHQPRARRHRSIKHAQSGKSAFFRSQPDQANGAALVGRRGRESTRGQGL